MKIGINARFLVHPYTGVGQYTRHLLQSLGRIDRKNEYFLFTPELVELDLPDHMHQIRVPEPPYQSASFRKAHWEHGLIPSEMLKWKVDRAHFLYPSNPWRRLGMPTIVTVHDMIPWRLPAYNHRLRSKLYHLYTRFALKKADHLIAVSEFSKREIMTLFKIKEKNITVIPHGLPLTSAEPKLPDFPLRRPFFFYVGGYDERKNVPHLIRAYLKHVANFYAVDLILAGAKGKGFESCLTSEYAQWVTTEIPVQPKGQVIFTEPLAANELNAFYRQALALVHPSFYEGFNLPLVEAAAAGLPLVVSDIPVNHEVAREAALFFDPRSVDSIGMALHRFLNDKPLQKELSKKGIEMARHYSWRKSAEETLDVYNLF